MLKENYKQKREELDELLILIDVPKWYWHQLNELEEFLIGYNRIPPTDISATKALEIVQELKNANSLQEL